MNSKSILFLCLVIFTTSCSEFLKGRTEKQDVLKISISDDTCVLNFKSQLQKIIKSESSPEETNQVFNCVDKYMTQFQNRVDGEKTPDQYDVQDFLYITNRFFKDMNLSTDAIQKIINFKRALVGGSSEIVTKAEISHLKSYFKFVQAEVMLLSPYFKYLNPEKSEVDLTEIEILNSTEQFRVSAKRLVQASNLLKSKYSYQEAKDLLHSLQVLSHQQTDAILIADKTRQLIVGDQTLNTAEAYAVVIDNIVDAYKIFKKAQYGYVKFELKSALTAKSVVMFFDSIVDLLSSTYQFKKTARLSTNDLDAVLEILMIKKVFPFEVKFETFQDFYKTALKRVFAQTTTEFITKTQFEYYRNEAALFKLEIKFLENLYSEFRFADISEIRKKIKLFNNSKTSLMSDIDLELKNKELVYSNFTDLNSDLESKYPILIKNEKYVILRSTTSELFEESDLLRSFYIKMWSRQLLLGWGDGKTASSFATSKITETQMTLFKKEFQQISNELKVNDPRSKPTGEKAFLEANLFGFSSNGDEYMSMSETFEYLHYLITEGSWTTNQVRLDLLDAGCEINEQDVFGNNWAAESCFVENLRNNYSRYFSNKPELVRYLSNLSRVQFNEYYTLLMDVARTDLKNKNIKIETADIQNFIVLTSYIESMFIKYDTNKSMSLSADEIRTSYGKFKSFATTYSTVHATDALKKWDSRLNYCRLVYSKEDLVQESFIFMVLNKGLMPTMSDMNYITCGVKGIFTFKNEIDRKSIIYTFLVLKSVLASE